MAKVKFYQRSKEINGVKYTAQFNGLSAWLKCVDASYIEGTQTTSAELFSENLLKMGLVEPKVTVDDFETQAELNDVTEFVKGVMRGDFRDTEAPAKAKG